MQLPSAFVFHVFICAGAMAIASCDEPPAPRDATAGEADGGDTEEDADVEPPGEDADAALEDDASVPVPDPWNLPQTVIGTQPCVEERAGTTLFVDSAPRDYCAGIVSVSLSASDANVCKQLQDGCIGWDCDNCLPTECSSLGLSPSDEWASDEWVIQHRRGDGGRGVAMWHGYVRDAPWGPVCGLIYETVNATKSAPEDRHIFEIARQEDSQCSGPIVALHPSDGRLFVAWGLNEDFAGKFSKFTWTLIDESGRQEEPRTQELGNGILDAISDGETLYWLEPDCQACTRGTLHALDLASGVTEQLPSDRRVKQLLSLRGRELIYVSYESERADRIMRMHGLGEGIRQISRHERLYIVGVADDDGTILLIDTLEWCLRELQGGRKLFTHGAIRRDMPDSRPSSEHLHIVDATSLIIDSALGGYEGYAATRLPRNTVRADASVTGDP